MKRIFIAAIAAVTALLAVSCGDNDRSHILKIYNWGDYIDESLIPEFEQWYEEQTGEPVKIVYQTFDINETMLSKIEKGHEDYDLACPSDYIIERMLMNDLILPIDKDFGETPNYLDNVAPFIKESFKKIDGKGKDANDYSVGFMWGTTGILYNAKYVNDDEAKTWDIIRNPKFDGKIFIKDAPRDVYGPVLIYLNRDKIAAGEKTLDELMYDSSDESIAAVEAYMKQAKELVAGWEADFGKEQMTQEKGYVNFTWSGDAVWAIREAEDVGVELRYQIPEEGSNIWFDGWVIPKYAQNVKAARYFINYMCKPENAIRNMDVIGYVSCVGGDTVLEAIQDDKYEPVNLSYFFGPEADSVCTDAVQYPDLASIGQCTMLHDWADETPKLIEMWSRIKGDSASSFTYILIAVVLVAALVLGISRKMKQSRRHKKSSNR